jgi:uncharacterized membrane protein
MPEVENSIEIAAPVETVFDVIANQPERMVDWWPPYELNERVTPAPTRVDSVSRYVYNMMGVKLKGEHKVMEMRENEFLRVQTISGIDSTFEFTFLPSDTGTNLDIRVVYTVPGGLIGKALNKLAVEKKNEEDLNHGLQNLKQLIEGGV